MFRTTLALTTAILFAASSAPAAETGNTFLGIHGEAVSADAGQSGARIVQVLPDSPAANAGLQLGDLVLAIGDKPVTTFADLANEVRNMSAGDEVEITVLREGKEEKLNVTLGERPAAAPAPGQFPFFGPEGLQFRIPGMNQPGGINVPLPPGIRQYLPTEKRPMIGVQLQPLDEALRDRLNLGEVQGVLVTDVVPESPASKADLKEMDVLLEVNGQAIADPQMLSDMVGTSKAGDEITLKVRRGDETMDKKLVVAELAASGPRIGNLGNRAAEFAESVLIPRATVDAMQKKIDDLEKKVSQLTQEVEAMKAQQKPDSN